MKITFEDARTKFQAFLAQQGYSQELLWIRVADVISSGKPLIYVRRSKNSEKLCRADYEAGISGGLGVLLRAIGEIDCKSCCYVWTPKSLDEAQRMLMPRDGGLKMQVRSGGPKLELKLVRNPFLWGLLGLWHFRTRAYANELLR
jgi:hypothetical protein